MKNKVDKFMTDAQQHGFSFEAATQIALHEAQQTKGDYSPQLSFNNWEEFQSVHDFAYKIGEMMSVSSNDLQGDLQGEEKAFVKLYKGTVYEVLYTLPCGKVVIKWAGLFR